VLVFLVLLFVTIKTKDPVPIALLVFTAIIGMTANFKIVMPYLLLGMCCCIAV
jgi:hypothetical protein